MQFSFLALWTHVRPLIPILLEAIAGIPTEFPFSNMHAEPVNFVYDTTRTLRCVAPFSVEAEFLLIFIPVCWARIVKPLCLVAALSEDVQISSKKEMRGIR